MTIFYSDFKDAYNRARNHDQPEFSVERHRFVTDFAKYMIEFLESKECPDDMILEFHEEPEGITIGEP